MKIGICDYGIGGIGLVQKIREHSNVDIVYISDAGFTPYGQLSEEELKQRIDQVVAYFHSMEIEHVAIACNAASTVIEKSNPKTIGIIEPAIKMVRGINPDEIAVVGGGRTIQSKVYEDAFTALGIQTYSRVAQQLSIRIEAGDLASKELDQDIETIFEPIKNVQHVLLACTHYPTISDRILRYTENSIFLDPADEMSKWILDNWPITEGSNQIDWFTTGNLEQMKTSAQAAFNQKINNIKFISL